MTEVHIWQLTIVVTRAEVDVVQVEPVLCTITGEPPAFYIDEGDEDWHYANKEILGRAELLSECSAAMFSGVVIPCAAGNCMDLAKDSAVGALLREFNLMDSENDVIWWQPPAPPPASHNAISNSGWANQNVLAALCANLINLKK